MLTPIKEIIINDYKINWRTKWESVKKESEIIRDAYRVFRRGAVPTVLWLILNHNHKNISLKIIQSNHNKFKKLKCEHPEYFDCIGNKEYNLEICELLHLNYQLTE